jgi:hypothetical protein
MNQGLHPRQLLKQRLEPRHCQLSPLLQDHGVRVHQHSVWLEGTTNLDVFAFASAKINRCTGFAICV